MSLSVLIDMNLSPDWVGVFVADGWNATHWSTIGDPRASDLEIMAWAVANRHLVFTHDLDFGTTLALTHATDPSVFQVRGEDILPDAIAALVLAALHQHEAELASGRPRRTRCMQITSSNTADLKSLRTRPCQLRAVSTA